MQLLKEESLANKLISKGFWLYFFSYLIWPIGYFTRVIISNSLSVEDVWILYSIIWFIWLLSWYSGLGLWTSLSYFLPKYYIKNKMDSIKTAILMNFGVQIITSIIVIFVLFFGSNWLSLHYFHSPESAQILKYFCIYFLWTNLLSLFQQIFISFQDTFNNKSTDFIRLTSVFLFTLFFFLTQKWDITHYSLAWIFGLFIWLIIASFIFIKKYLNLIKWPTNRNKQEIKTYLKYSFWTFLGMNAWILLGQIDQQMIIVLMWPESAWYYSNYLSLWQISTVIIGPIFALLFPMFTELLAKKDKEKTSLLQNFLYTYLTVFTLSLSTLFLVLWPEIAAILFGVKFAISWKLLQFSTLFLFLGMLLNINFSMLSSMWKVKTNVKILWIAAFMNIILNYFLIQWIGLYWAIVATIRWTIFMWIYSNHIIKKEFPLSIQWKYLGKNLILFVVLWLWLLYLKNKLFVLDDTLRYHNLLIIILIGVTYYFVILLFNYKRIIMLKNQILQMIKK